MSQLIKTTISEKNPSGRLHLSTINPALFSRLWGVEALAEGILQKAKNEDLHEWIYLLHDVLLADKNPKINDISFYFDQPKEKIDDAIALFRANRDDLCTPKDLKPTEYPMLQLYLLYDCLLHVGSLARRTRQIGYLSKRPKYPWRIGIDQFVKDAPYGRPYNYAVVNGQALLGPAVRYHSEVASGQPAEAVGQAVKLRDKEGRVSILISNETGHYRVPYYTIHKMAGIVTRAINDNADALPSRPNVVLCPGSIQKAMDRMR